MLGRERIRSAGAPETITIHGDAMQSTRSLKVWAWRRPPCRQRSSTLIAPMRWRGKRRCVRGRTGLAGTPSIPTDAEIACPDRGLREPLARRRGVGGGWRRRVAAAPAHNGRVDSVDLGRVADGGGGCGCGRGCGGGAARWPSVEAALIEAPGWLGALGLAEEAGPRRVADAGGYAGARAPGGAAPQDAK